MPVLNRSALHVLASTAPGFGEDEARSATLAHRRELQRTLSEQFWGFDLCRDFPKALSNDGVAAVRGDLARIGAFLAEQFPTLTQEALNAVPSASVAQTKHEYLSAACDLIELRRADETVGIIVGAPEDWSTYYVRSFAFKSEYQRPVLTRRAARECLIEPLQACGVERLVADTSPANVAMSRLLGELRFFVTGHQLSDRWGTLVRYTRFLDAACEAAFVRRFGGTAPPCSTGGRKEEP